jgi:hypothetical protein
MPERRIDFLTKPMVLLGVYVVITIGVSLHRYFLGEDHYGNYLIFKNSFLHLLEGKDLYALYPDLKIDLFKYSPTFAVLFSVFSFLPDAIGMVLWNLVNALFLFFAIQMIRMDERKRVFILWFILIELITSLQNYQSNALTAALIIFVFVFLERSHLWQATLALAVGFYIKVFGILSTLFWFFYPGKGKFFLYSLAAMAALLLLPLLFISPAELTAVYQSWFHLISTDAPHHLNHSVMSILKTWLGVEVDKIWIQLVGILLLSAPLVLYKHYKDYTFRLLFLCSVLIGSVIFNHKAESATYLIAVVGCGIWFFNSNRKSYETSLIVLMFLLTCLSPTDMFPKFVRDNYIVPYSLKALPCILIWIRIQYELLSFRRTEAVS